MTAQKIKVHPVTAYVSVEVHFVISLNGRSAQVSVITVLQQGMTH
jgi:hypothetical protein